MTQIGTRIRIQSSGVPGAAAPAPFHPTVLGATFKADWDSRYGIVDDGFGEVITWTDQRSGLVATPTGGPFPGCVVVANQIDGKPAIRFVLGKAPAAALNTILSASGLTFYVVCMYTTLLGDSAANPYTNSCVLRTPSGRFAQALRVTGPTAQVMHEGGGAFPVAVGDSAAAEDVYALSVSRHGGGFLSRRWADQPYGTPVACANMSVMTDVFELGSPNFTGDIIRVLCFDSGLSVENDDLVRDYLQSEYPTGITV